MNQLELEMYKILKELLCQLTDLGGKHEKAEDFVKLLTKLETQEDPNDFYHLKKY